MTASPEDLSSDCYYKNLGISKTASDQEIKSAYRKLALKYHPDKNKDNAERASENFKKVSEAYDCLSDKEKRQIFDTYGKRGLDSGGCGGGGFGGGRFINPDDIFRQFFASNGGFNDDFGGFVGGGFFNMDGERFGGHGGFRGGHPGMRQRKPQAPPRYPKGPNVIQKGTSVVVHSLVGSPQYNGMTGTLVHYDVDKDRYRVAFGGDEENAISVKASNFVQMLENVRLRDITSRPQLNGCQGQVIGVNGQRYHVKLAGADSVVVSVALSNLILPTEVRVHVHSLSGAPQYNGKTGQVMQFLEADNRYLIEIEGNKQLKLKMDNLLI